MTTVHFRPKYDIEQYLVQFSFPSPLDSFPTISVDVESGDDSDAEGLAGLPIWQGQGSDVFVRVTGGTAGSVYRITCSSFIGGIPVSRSGLIAVMPTAAEIPEGTPPAPLARYYTTPPYPLESVDHLAMFGARIGSAERRPLVNHIGAFSTAGLGARMGSAVLREPLSDAYAGPSLIAIGAHLGTAAIRRIRHDVDAADDNEIALGSRIGTGHQKRVRFDANVPTDPVRLGARIGTGELI